MRSFNKVQHVLNVMFLFLLTIALWDCAERDKFGSYLDPALPIEQRVSNLMAQMTLEEKVGQMCQYIGPLHLEKSKKRVSGDEVVYNDQWGVYPGMSTDSLYGLVRSGVIGSFLHIKNAEEANELQRFAQQSRLKIPLLIGVDAIHGHALVSGATVYPTQLGLSSTWDDDLLYRVARATAAEVRATGMHWSFSPNIDIARDPRWGRIGETFGEDPYMVTQMGLAFTKGYQEDLEGNGILACAKHFIAGSEPYNGLNVSPMDVSMRQLRELWLPPYQAQVRAGVGSFMAAHNEINGIPCHGNRMLLHDILRDEWNYDGFVVSDWMDIERLEKLHAVAENAEQAVKLSVDAGIDMHMHGPGFLEAVLTMVHNGEISESRVEEACRRILTAKFKLGLFENPFVDVDKMGQVMFNSDHQQLALEAARKSIVLLKNDEILPLRNAERILVTGPNADNQRLLGDWAYEQPDDNITTIYEGVKSVFGESDVDFLNSGESLLHPDEEQLEKVLEMASDYDAVIVVVGSNSLRYDIDERTCGENIARSSINLLGNQLALVQRLYEKNKNVVVVFVNGRPLAEPWIKEHIPAIIEAWEPGALGGQAVAEVIAGEVNPSGKLTVTIPYSVGQIHMTYNHKPSSTSRKYVDGPTDPLWPFGYGLSYTDYRYNDLALSKDSLSKSDTLEVSIRVANTGKMSGEEIVQLYVRDEFASVTRPVKELKRYKRVSLNVGEVKQITFQITPEDLAIYDAEMNYTVEKGGFTVMVGSSSEDNTLLSERFYVE